jgi:nitrous oxide reductase accessory protein NosL
MFDDFNCQINFERDELAPEIVTRWVHDHASLNWLPAVAAHYTRSSTLHTPMASGVAAFESPKAAAQFADSLEGEVVTFQELWKR